MLRYQKVALALVVTGAIFFAGAYSMMTGLVPEQEPRPTLQDEGDSQAQEEAPLKALIVSGAKSKPLSDEDSALPATTPEVEEPSQPVPPSQSDDNGEQASGFTEDRISERLELQSRYFFRCYSHLLETNPSQKGQVVVAFTIASDGKVSLAQVASSDFENEVFHRCVIDVIERTPFPSFEGRPVSTLFPIEFE